MPPSPPAESVISTAKSPIEPDRLRDQLCARVFACVCARVCVQVYADLVDQFVLSL